VSTLKGFILVIGFFIANCTPVHVKSSNCGEVSKFEVVGIADTSLSILTGKLADLNYPGPVLHAVFYFATENITLKRDSYSKEGKVNVFVPPGEYRITIGGIGYQRFEIGRKELKSGYIYRIEAGLCEALMSQ